MASSPHHFYLQELSPKQRQQVPWRICVDYGYDSENEVIRKIYATWVKIGWFGEDVRGHEERAEGINKAWQHRRATRTGTGGLMLESIIREHYSCKVEFAFDGGILYPLRVVPWTTPLALTVDVADIELGSVEPTSTSLRLHRGKVVLKQPDFTVHRV